MISRSLRRSSVLMAKVPEIIEGMLKQNKVVDAVYFTFCFGLEDRFNPQRLLTSFLHESEESLNKIQKYEQMKTLPGSVLSEIIGVKKRYLGILKSVIQCLGRNDIDHSKFLPEWQIGRKAISLEKEIAKLRKELKHDKMMVQKRKIDETESLSNKEAKHSHFPNPWPPQQQRVVNHVYRKDTLLEGGGTAGHIYGHSLYPSVFHGPVAGLIHDNVVASLAGPVGSVDMAGPGAGISAGMDVVLSRVGGSHGGATVYD